MRAAQLNENNVVINYAEVNSFGSQFIDPLDSIIGSIWNGTSFSHPPPPAPTVPQQVTMRQARLALLGAGKLSAVDAAIASLSSPQKEGAQIEWEYSSTVERNRQFVQLLAPALGLSDADLDQLFIAAATL